MTEQDVNESWEAFKKERSFQKATSIQGQLDTMAAMLQEIQNDTKRTAGVIDQIQGDNAAIDYENANADPMAAMGGVPPEAAPEGAPEGAPEDVPPEEGEEPLNGGAESDEDMAAEDVPMDEAPEGELPPAGAPDGAPPADLPPMPEAGAEDMAPPVSDVPAPAPSGGDIVSKIKDLIANTSDPQTLRGLSELLSTALDQAPAAPMESADAAPPTLDGGMMKSFSKTEDVETSDCNDGLDLVKREIADAVNSDLGEDFHKSEDFQKADDPVEEAKDAVSPKTEDAPEPQTTDSFANSEDAPEEDESEEDEPEVKAEVVTEVAPEAEPENPVVEEIAEKVTEAVEGIVESVLEGDSEEKEERMPRFSDMMEDDFEKSDVPEISDDKDSEDFKECNDSKQVHVTEDFTESEDDAQVHAKFGDVQTGTMKKAQDTGIHLRSIADIMSEDSGSFTKSADRPGIELTYGHNPNRPSLSEMEKQTKAIPSIDELMDES